MKNILFIKANIFSPIIFGVLLFPAILAGFLFVKPALASDWASTSASLITPRGSFASVVFKNKIYILGGDLAGAGATNKIESYDQIIDEWKEEVSTIEPRWGLAAAVIDGQMITVSAGSPVPSGSVSTESYNPETGFTQRKANMPKPGWGAAAVSVGHKMYVFGGYNWFEEGQNYNREYDSFSDTWTLKQPMPSRRSWISAEVIDGKVYVLGGWNYNDTRDLPDLDVYDPQTDSWDSKTPLPIGLKAIATAVLNGKLYAIGGMSGQGGGAYFSDRVFVYDPAINHWQEMDRFPIAISNAGAKVIGDTLYVFGGFTYGAPVVRTYYLGERPLESAKRNPVIIVPGIIASYLNNATTSDEFSLGEEVWPNIEKMKGIGDNYLDYLKLDKTNQEIRHIVDPVKILKELEGNDFFAGLIQELKNNGYEEERNLFVFPYDWRLNLNWTAGDSPYSWQETLKQKIEDVLATTSAQKVDIIAHSMGGLVVKNYIEKYPQDAENNIGKFVDIATPHLGSPSVFKILNYGDNLGFCKVIIGFPYCILNNGKIKDISQNMPSAYQLLPSQKYFTYDFPWASKGYVYDTKYEFPLSLTSGYLDYDESINYLRNKGRNDFFLGFSGDNPVNINNELHDRLDNLPEKDNYYNIIGCGADTYAGVKALGMPRPLDPVRGDGTVPLQSALDFGHKKYYVATSSHAFLPSFNGVRQLAVSILKNQEDSFDFSPYDYLSQDMSVCPGVSGTQIGAHSPVELHLYDEHGNHAGPIENGDIEEGILGVIYDVLGENKYAWLPSGRNYQVVNKATSSGELGITIRKVENDQATEFVYFNSIPLLSASTVVDYTIVDNQANYQVQLDSNGDGITEENIAPSSVLTGEQIDDSIAPTTTISVFGQSGNNNYYISAVEIELAANDGADGAGVLKTDYSLDNGQAWSKYEGKIIISDDGEHNILYYSTDKAGNLEDQKEKIIKIDRTAPEITMLIPQEGQEINHDEKLDIEYLSEDNFSGLAADQDEIYFDGEKIYSKEVDLFLKKLGEHKVKIIANDQAGNQVEKEVRLNVVTTITGTIANINRAYLENLINQKANDSLIKEMEDIQKYINKYAKKEEKKRQIEKAIMDKCIAKKGRAWCAEKLGDIFNKVDYRLNKIQQKIILAKYELILKKLELYQKIGWITKTGGGIIEEDIKYLTNNIK